MGEGVQKQGGSKNLDFFFFLGGGGGALKSSYLTEGRGGPYKYSKRAIIGSQSKWRFAGGPMVA